MTKCSSSILTGAIQVRSGLQRAPSNRDLTRVNNHTTPGKDGITIMRAMRAEGFSGYKDLKLVDIPNPVLRAHVTKALRSWLSRLQTIVDHAQARDETQPGVDPKTVATLIVASLEGALMMRRIHRSDEALQRVQAHLNRYLDEEVAGS